MSKGDEVNQDFRSKFLTDAENMRERLDARSPSLCLAKWKQVSLHLTTGHTNSCYHPPLHRITPEDVARDVSGIHNTEHKKQQRRMMLAGERPRECQYCWNMEDLGQLSDRHYRSGEPWAALDFDRIANSTGDEDWVPSYVEVNFSNACNLRCSYCSPQFSTNWQQEAEQHGAYPTSKPHNAPEHFEGERRPIPNREHNPYLEAFWQWWPRLYPELQHFRMTGGEPLMDRNTFRVFDYVLENPNPGLHLNVTSNFSVDERLWQKYKGYVQRLCENDNVEHFMQYVSLDSWGAQAQYIRDGLNFELLWDRVHQYLSEIPYRNSLTFIITMNNLSVTGLKTLLENILDLRMRYSHSYQRVWFDTPVLRQPNWQSLQILPESYQYRMRTTLEWMRYFQETPERRFQGFKDYEIQRMERDIAWMSQPQNTTARQKKMADFYRFFSEHDRRRGTDFLATFPEMRAWWQQCELYARES